MDEKRAFLTAIVVLTIAFFLAYNGIRIDKKSPYIFLIAFLGVGTGFLFHELAHREIAKKYGANAFFVVWPEGLGMALLFSIFGFVFAAPGAVYIIGNLDSEKNGKVALAGPLANIILALVFLAFSYVFRGFAWLFYPVGGINAFLAFFNLLPIPPLDGSKVFVWNTGVWLLFLAFSGILAFLVF